MIERKHKNVLVRIVVLLGLELLFVLGLFLALECQSGVIGLAVEERSCLVDNLIANSSFEPPTSTTGTCQGRPAAHGWSCYTWGSDNATLLWDPYEKHSGTHSVLIFGHDDGAGAVWITDPRFSIEAGEQYSFTGWVRADYIAQDARALLALYLFDDGGRDVGYYKSNYVSHSTLSEPNGGWVQVKGSAIIPGEAAEARLDAKLVGEGYVRFDDVIVSKGPLVPFLVPDVDASPNLVSPTGTLTYIVAVTNTGGIPARSVRLTGTLDSRTTLIYSDTSQASSYTVTDTSHVWSFADALAPEGGSLSVILVVTMGIITDAHISLSSTFEVKAEDIETISIVKTTAIDLNDDFELSPCKTGLAAPGVALDYVHTITNIAHCPISYTASPLPDLPIHPRGCGDVAAYPENTGLVSSFHTTLVTLAFTANPDAPNNCLALLRVQALNNYKVSPCEARVIPKPLDLDMVGSPDPVQAGGELTYTLSYTYAGGINTESLRITVTLGEPANVSAFDPSPGITVSKQTYVWLPTTDHLGGTGNITVTANIPVSSTGIVASQARIATRDAEPVTREITTKITEVEEIAMYLPLVLRCWSDVPAPPELESPVAGGGGSYTVRWRSVPSDCFPLPTYYVLQEDQACDCGRIPPTEVYSGQSTFYTANKRGAGRYCYRAKACNNRGCSGWSNEECVDVFEEHEDNNNDDGADGPLCSSEVYRGKPNDLWDCFRIDLYTGGQISIRLDNHIEGQCTQLLVYYESQGNLIEPCQFIDPSDRTSECDVTETGAGTYFICIYTTRPDPNKTYTLQATFP